MLVRTRSRIAIAASLLVLHGGAARGQDSHYWSQQYGARAELLGGIAVGSLLDVSSTYYNPGALVLVSSREYLQSALPFQVQHVSLERNGTSGEKLSTLDLGNAPSLFAGLLPFTWWGGRLAYSTLTRHEFKISLKHRVGATDFLGQPGLLFAAENTFRQELSELWAGLTWSRAVGERTGIGLTHYFTYRGQSSRQQSIAQTATEDTGDGASTTLIDDYDYWSLGLVWKLGVAFDYSPMSFGFSFTTPDVDFYGTGKALFDRAITNIDYDNDGSGNSTIVARLEEGLWPRHKSPLSVAGGWAYRFRSSAIHLGAEWFAPVSRYTVMDAGLEDRIGEIRLSRQLTEELDDVLNFGVGVEHTFNDRIKYFGSFRTDFSASVPESNANLSITKWNLYHVSSGGTFRFSSVDVTLGVTYSFGGEDIPTRVDLGNASENNLWLGGPGAVRVDYRLFRVLFGFTFNTL